MFIKEIKKYQTKMKTLIKDRRKVQKLKVFAVMFIQGQLFLINEVILVTLA